MDTIPKATPPTKPGMKPAKKKRRSGRWVIDLLLLVALVALGYQFYQAEQARKNAQQELQTTTSELEQLRQSTENSGNQVAQEILTKARKHIRIPQDPAPSVATITNIEELQKTSQFYADAKNGDYLIITRKRAYLYNPEEDILLDVVPVNINSASPTPPAEGSDEQNTPGASTTPTPTPNP